MSNTTTEVLKTAIIEYCKSKDLNEGLIDNVLSHFNNILKNANDKRSARELERIANSGPAGEKAVKQAIELHKSIAKAGDQAQLDMEKLRKRNNFKYI